jgi:hypothetical protein
MTTTKHKIEACVRRKVMWIPVFTGKLILYRKLRMKINVKLPQREE